MHAPLLAHEMPGVGQERRHPCEFSTFLTLYDDSTPADLLQRKIYASVAIACKGGEWRRVSMVMLALALMVFSIIGVVPL